MTWNYVYTPQIWPAIFTTVLLVVLASYAWYRRSIPGALPFAIGSLFGALWIAGYGMEVAAVGVAEKIFWVKFQAIWQLPATTAITCFILEYVWPGRWVNRRIITILSIPLLAFLVLVLTDNIHHLLWRGFNFEGTVTPIRAPVLIFFIIYGFLLFVINLSVLVWLYVNSPPHRWPVAIMLAGQISFRSLYILDLISNNRSDLPSSILGFLVLILGYALVLFGFRILDPVMMAQKALIEHMHDSMILLDLQGSIENLNPAAERLLGTSTVVVKGKPLSDLLPEFTGTNIVEINEGETELSLEIRRSNSRPELRHFAVRNTLLKDFRNLEIGRLLLLHDITAQKQAQLKILEQQRALAMLNERTRLARELHDSIGQMLGYVSMQAQAIQKRARDGDLPAVDMQLTQLIEAAQEAHVDVRESILSLNIKGGEHWSFPTALQRYLEAYRENYGIQTQLILPEEVNQGWFEPEAELQLLRVIQEAMNNARKHGGAACVQINFIVQEDVIQVMIIDDGRGFNPEFADHKEPGHYGLVFMRERAEAIGGILKIDSSPGNGTSVLLEVKRNLKTG